MMRQWPSHHTTDRPKAQFAALAELRRSGSREVAAAAVEASGRDVVSGAGDVVVRRVGGEGKLPAELMKSVKHMLPDNKVVLGHWGGPGAASSPAATSSSGTRSPRTAATSEPSRLLLTTAIHSPPPCPDPCA